MVEVREDATDLVCEETVFGTSPAPGAKEEIRKLLEIGTWFLKYRVTLASVIAIIAHREGEVDSRKPICRAFEEMPKFLLK